MNEESLFQEAPARPADERASFLDKTCEGRPELRAAVEALPAAHDKSDFIPFRDDATQPGLKHG